MVFFLLAAGFWAAPTGASSALRMTFAELVLESDRVVEAVLEGEGVSAWGPERRRIYTTFAFRVEEDLAGAGPGRIVIVQPGGQVGRLAQRAWGYPRFRPGERVLLFLEKMAAGYRVVGLCQGVFGIQRRGDEQMLYQRLEGLSFLGDDGRALVLQRAQAHALIRTLWPQRRAP